MSDKEFADFARIAPQRSIITTDLGQVGMPHPVDRDAPLYSCVAGKRACTEAGGFLWYVAIPPNLSDFLYLNKLYMETEQHIYFSSQ